MEKGLYRNLIRIGLPVTIQSLLAAIVNMVDTMMVGSLGDQALAAVGQSNRFMLVVNVFFFGINAGMAIFLAQFWGKKDLPSIKRVTGVAMGSTLLAGAFVTVLLLVAPKLVVGVYIADPAVIEQGASYIRIVALSILFFAISSTIGSSMKSIGHTRLPMVVSIVALSVNVLLNYLLIFGHFGFPRMGIRGAAVATVVARVLECALILMLAKARKSPVLGRIREHLDFTLKYVVRVFRTARWVVLNELFWALGFSLYSAIFGHMGVTEAAAMQVANILFELVFLCGVGISTAAAMLVGSRIGAGQEDMAYHDSVRVFRFTVAAGIVLAIPFGLGAPQLAELFHLSAEASAMTDRVILVMCLFVPLRIFNLVLIVGILRSGGKALFTLMLDAGSVWLIGLPAGLLAAFVFHLPLSGVYAVITIEEGVKLVIGLRRFRNRKMDCQCRVRNGRKHERTSETARRLRPDTVGL